MLSTTFLALSALSAISSTTAQTYSKCNPLTTTCAPNPGLNAQSFYTDFTQPTLPGWTALAGTYLTSSSAGSHFTIATAGNAPTIGTDFYVHFGLFEVTMRSAPGTGIISSIVLESDDLDEIDWEFLGGVDTSVQTNFFGKGNTTTYDRMVELPVSSPTTTCHTYAIDWKPESLSYLIDGKVLRTVNYGDAIALGGKNYPQTPAKLKLGSWAGGASASAGTVTWAGGATDFSQAPFTMYVQSVKITNYRPAASYTYSDHSGDYRSIIANQAAKRDVEKRLPSTMSSMTMPSSTATSTSVSSTTTAAHANAAGQTGVSRLALVVLAIVALLI